MTLPTHYPYPTYKHSGIEWLGDIPAHWDLLSGRACYSFGREPNTGMREHTVLSLSYGKLRIRHPDELHGLVPASFETYQVIQPGDIVCRPTDLQNDWNSLRFGLSTHKGIITSAYMRLRPTDSLTKEYGYALLHTYDLMKVFYGLGSGLRQNLRWEDFKLLPCLVPPLPEQRAIVRFLDRADERIQRFVSAKERLIALLEEERQAIINHAVTRGPDPNAQLKPSGVEWLGDVPAHWEVVSLRYLATKFGSGVTPRGGATVYQETGIPFLRSQNIHFGGIDLENVVHISPSIHQAMSSSSVKPGDVLLNITGASIGRVCSVPNEFPEGNVNQHVCIIRPKIDVILPEFMSAFLSTSIMQSEIRIEQSGASREGLTLQSIRGFMIPMPPISEQRRIVNEISKQTDRITTLTVRARRQIELVEEYRARLIADAVTGKIDVREAGAMALDDAEESVP